MKKALILPLLLATLLCQAQARKQGFVVTLNGSPRDTISLSELDTNSTIGLVINDTNGQRIRPVVAGYNIVIGHKEKAEGFIFDGHSPKLDSGTVSKLSKLNSGDKFFITCIRYWPDKEKRKSLDYFPMKTIHIR